MADTAPLAFLQTILRKDSFARYWLACVGAGGCAGLVMGINRAVDKAGVSAKLSAVGGTVVSGLGTGVVLPAWPFMVFISTVAAGVRAPGFLEINGDGVTMAISSTPSYVALAVVLGLMAGACHHRSITL